MLQEGLPPGYEIVTGDIELFVKKDGNYVFLFPEKRRVEPH